MSFINFANQVANTAKAASNAAAKAADKALDGVTKELKEAEDAFNTGTLVEGATELLDATSTGTAVSNALSAIGLVPENGPGKELVSAVVNFATPIPTAPLAGLKDLADAFSKSGIQTRRAGGSTGLAHCALPHFPAPPRAHYHQIQCGRIPGPVGFAISADIHLNRAVRGALDPLCYTLFPGSALVLGPWRALQTRIEDMILKAIKGQPKGHWVWCPHPGRPHRPGRPLRPIRPNRPRPIKPPVLTPSKPERGTPSAQDILRNPNLSFEDRLFLFMCKFIQDQEEQIKQQMAYMEANKSNSTEASKGTDKSNKTGGGGGAGAPPVMNTFSAAFQGGQNALMSGENLGALAGLAKSVLPMAMPALKAAVGAIPKVGPMLAPLMDTLAPMALDAVGGMAEQMGKQQGSQRKAGEGATVVRQSLQASGCVPPSGKTKEGEKSDKDPEYSEAMEMEKLKKMTQDLQKMQNALSNVLNNMHNSAMNAIRNIK